MPSEPTEWSDLVDIHHRLDSTIMFTMIRFVYAILAARFADSEIALLCLVGVLATGATMGSKLHSATKLLAQVVFSLSSALLSQAIINIATNQSQLLHQNVQSGQRLLLDFVVVTSLLVSAAMVPDRLASLPYINRAITLLLYMYTDATEYMIARLNLGLVSTFVCVLLYVILIRFKHALLSYTTLQYLIKALNMVSINIVLASAGTINNNLTSRNTQAVLVVIILFIIDALHRVTGVMQEGRDFAVWKGSKILYEIFTTMDVDTTVTIFSAVLFIAGKHFLNSNNSTLIEVFLLVTVNNILDNLDQYTAHAFNMDKVLTLFMYVIVIHCVSNVISQ